MFQSKNMNHYIFALVLIVGASYVGNKFKNYFVENKEVEYDMIKEYLLNDSPLYGFNKPKLWIHSFSHLNLRLRNSAPNGVNWMCNATPKHLVLGSKNGC